MPVPAWITWPVPLSMPLKSLPWVSVLVRLNFSVPLLLMTLSGLSDPLIPALPSCKVPWVMVVALV